jgi:formamidase
VAIETAARTRLQFRLHKDPPWRPRHPFITFGKHVASTGISVDENGRNRYLDAYAAAAAAAADMLEYLQVERGLSAEQAYAMFGVAVDLQISEIVNAPNAVVSAVLPLDVFE